MFRVTASDIVINLPELLVSFAFVVLHLHVLIAALANLLDCQFGARVAEESRRWRQQTVTIKPPQGWINFLLRQVALKIMQAVSGSGS